MEHNKATETPRFATPPVFAVSQFEKQRMLILHAWYSDFIAEGGKPVEFMREVIVRIHRVQTVFDGKLSVNALFEPIPPRADDNPFDSSSAGPVSGADGHTTNASRSPNEQGRKDGAERLVADRPAQHESASGQEADAQGREPSAGSAPQDGGRGHNDLAGNGRHVSASPVRRNTGPNELQREIAREVAQSAAKTILETFRFANGSALGEVYLNDLENYEMKSSVDAFVARQIRLAFKGHPNCRVKELPLGTIEAIVSRANKEAE
jgi:hypothetical protein